MANQISRKFQNVTWKNIETKDAVNCHILLNFDDGTTQILKAVVSNPSEGSPNPDWTQIMEEIGADLIDSNTTEAIQVRDSQRESDRLTQEDQAAKDLEFQKQEVLFAMKLESFEIEAIKNSTDRASKALIRKSKSILEVQAYTTILLMKELENANKQESTTEEPE
jgi:hypothetical protein